MWADQVDGLSAVNVSTELVFLRVKVLSWPFHSSPILSPSVTKDIAETVLLNLWAWAGSHLIQKWTGSDGRFWSCNYYIRAYQEASSQLSGTQRVQRIKDRGQGWVANDGHVSCCWTPWLVTLFTTTQGYGHLGCENLSRFLCLPEALMPQIPKARGRRVRMCVQKSKSSVSLWTSTWGLLSIRPVQEIKRELHTYFHLF